MNTTHTARTGRPRGIAAVLIALTTAVLGGLLSIASPAQATVTAQTTTAYIGGGTNVNVRTSPVITNANVAYVLPVRTTIIITCQLVGGKLGFSQYAENRTWNQLSDGRFIHDAVTTSPADQARVSLPDGGYVRFSSNIPRCGATQASREQRAAQYAESMVGVAIDSGYCERFVERAFGTSGRFYSAQTNYNTQRAAGRIHTDTNPPRGTLVFYTYSDLGHVGISLGDGRVVSTKVSGPVRVTPVTGWGLTYLGWSYAPADWPGR